MYYTAYVTNNQLDIECGQQKNMELRMLWGRTNEKKEDEGWNWNNRV